MDECVPSRKEGGYLRPDAVLKETKQKAGILTEGFLFFFRLRGLNLEIFQCLQKILVTF